MHALAIVATLGLLAGLGATLELTLKSHWAQIRAALAGELPRS